MFVFAKVALGVANILNRFLSESFVKSIQWFIKQFAKITDISACLNLRKIHPFLFEGS